MSNSGGLYYAYQIVFAFLCYLKVFNPDLIEEICRGEIDAENVLKLAGLSLFEQGSDHSHINSLQRLIEYAFGDEETQKKMQEEGKVGYQEFGRFSGNIIKTVSGWLSTISR